MKKDFKLALKQTLPVMFSYVFLGLAFGIALAKVNQGWFFSFLSSTFVFAGSMQFVMLEFIESQEPLYIVALMTIVINARYAVYSLSFIEHNKKYEWYRKLYLIHTLSDETYSILCATSLPFNEDKRHYDFYVSGLNHVYWIFGCVVGSFIGKISINFEGIDFVMTALFVCTFVDQLRSGNSKIPAAIAIVSSLIFLFTIGNYFILPALLLTMVGLLAFKPFILKKKEVKEDVSNDINE